MEQFTDKLSKKIGLQLGYTKDQTEVLAYGLFGILQTILLFSVLALIGGLTKTFFQILTALLGGSVLRKQAGGAHASSPSACNIISIITCTSIALLSTFALNGIDRSYIIISVFIIYLICTIIIFRKAPVDSENKRIYDAIKRRKLKNSSLAIGFIFTSISISIVSILDSQLFWQCSFSLCLAVLWQSISLTETGSKVLTHADKLLSGMNKNA